MTKDVDFLDRYEALGIAYPDPSTMCEGQCRGVGVYPHKVDDPDATEEEQKRWLDCHDKAHSWKAVFKNLKANKEWWFWKSIIKDLLNGEWFKCDGWHFIKCPDCEGTGLREEIE